MEVHAHTHTPRKKWRHYFWEFLMLFLAITLGFFVENQREHFVEHQRAKVYASNLYSELQKDTAQLNSLIKWTKTLSLRFDTLCEISLQQPVVTNGKLYYYSMAAGYVRYFSTQCATMEQLKNSGNLRIMSTEIVLKISEYGSRLKSLDDEYSLFKTEYQTLNSLRLKIFDGYISSKFYLRYNEAKFRDSVFLLNPPLLNNDNKLMKEFIGWAKIESIYWSENIPNRLEPLNKLATELIGFLKKEYHLK